MRNLILAFLFCLMPFGVYADAIDSLENLLRTKPQIQEKIYLHLDNNCYFLGDTLWYKAYVVTADDLKPTNMSRLLYVELLDADGFVVERQHVVVSDKGSTCGQFALADTLYSGYYEVRAYTKWQLNFNVTERYYNFLDVRRFYNRKMCEDFYRDFEGLYSRVVPVYDKPREKGEYADRYMNRRPKQHLLKDKPRLLASFYPEGGSSVEGIKGRLAFEVTDQNGQGMDVTGRLSDGTVVKTDYLGRGTVEYTPGNACRKAVFQWNGKDYSFALPKAQTKGTSLIYDAAQRSVTLRSAGVVPAAIAVMCRGRLYDFQRINGDGTYKLPESLPTGVNDVAVYDADAQPLASRLFFVDNHDMGGRLDVRMNTIDGEVGERTTLSPHEAVDLTVASVYSDSYPSTVSVSIRDSSTDDPAYDDGNIMTDMLLSSELKGFVAYPAYYFEKDDDVHRSRLDNLMMIQGWRRYKRVETARYMPEVTTTFEGTVHRIPNTATMLELDEVEAMMNSKSEVEESLEKLEALTASTLSESDSDEETEFSSLLDETEPEPEVIYADSDDDNHSDKPLRRSVLVEAEVTKDGQSAGVITETDKRGRFSIQIPPYYDSAVLFMKAYSRRDSLKKNMMVKGDKDFANERAFPDYYVKRDMFFPKFTQPYSWYQVNSPELFFVEEGDDTAIPENSRLAGNHQLQTVIVKAKRRGKRSIDRTKPALVFDAYNLYNDVTDYGLSWGYLDMKHFPQQVTTYLFGNMGRMQTVNIRAIMENHSFYRNYSPGVNEMDKNMSFSYMYDHLHLNRLQYVRVYADYELRTDSGDVHEMNSPDVTLDFVPLENDAKRYTYRDRRYIFPGITYAEEFYSPDYSHSIPEEPKDYRRTLYWNPNAKLNADCTFTTRFFNNSKETRLKVSAAGVGSDGRLYYSEQSKE